MSGPVTGAVVRHDVSLLDDDDLHLFNEGTHCRLHDVLGAHLTEWDGKPGTQFAVWAPNAASVHVVGDFNGWDGAAHPLSPRGSSGIWEGFVPGVEKGSVYKYRIDSREAEYVVDKADPFGAWHQVPPETASVVWDREYDWDDAGWMERRGEVNALDAPISVYEVHLGSWRRVPEAGNRSLDYREAADRLADYVAESGFTHVELLPIMEHPFYGSWGYQTTGFFAPTSRYGTPQDFMALVEAFHERGVGVILDWVPSHFPTDEHGLMYFDGTHLFEHSDPREGFHPDWNSAIFNYGRHEVRSFLISSAVHWLEHYHVDGIRVDAVASMLYRDYSREDGEWIPNVHGGRENLEALHFLRQLNETVYREFPDVQTIAEESTAWPMVSRPTWLGGLGFGMKWDMGWMHDTLQYFQREPVHRGWHHNDITFRMVYAFNENFMLPISHDEVVHGKGSLVAKMPGDDWQKLATLRLLLAYQWAQPGKKLLFMGCELGQWREWDHEASLDWHLLEEPRHAGIRHLVGDLNRVYRDHPALHELDTEPAGFEWVEANDAENSVLAFLRKARGGAATRPAAVERPGAAREAGGDPNDAPDPADEPVLAVFNFTPVPRTNYRMGVDRPGRWHEILNTDARDYGGSGWGGMGTLESTPVPYHGRPHSLVLTLPALGAVFLKRAAEGE